MAAAVALTDLKSRLAGLEQWLDAAARSESAYDDSRIENNINRWTREFERETRFRVNQVQVCGYPDGTYNSPDMETDVTGNLPLIVETPYTFEPWKWRMDYGPIRLYSRPVLQVQRVRITLGPQDTVISLPAEWLRIDKTMGEINIVPIRGTAQLATMAAGLAMLTTMGFSNTEYLPDSIAVDYIAGLPTGWQDSAEWGDVALALADWCALKLLHDIDHVFAAGLGVVSLSADGVSQQRQYDRFQMKKQELEARVQRFMDVMRAQLNPFTVVWA